MNQEYLNKLFDYEPVTGRLFWKKSLSNRVKVGDQAGSYMSNGYLTVQINKTPWLVHHLIWIIHNDVHPKEHLDHLNGIRNDNRIENLREAPQKINLRNAKMRSNNISGVTGVSFVAKRDKYKARIMVNYKEKHLGYHLTLAEAVAARENYIQTHPELGFTERHGQ